MVELPSRERIRWWFRSKPLDRLNSLSYWLCILFFSALLSLVFTALWQVQVIERQVQTAEQARLRHVSDDLDWIYENPRNALEAHRETFLEKLWQLKKSVQSGDPSESQGKNLLRSAKDIKDFPPSAQEAYMFGNRAIKVYPSFATYSPKREPHCATGEQGLSEEEQFAFNNFAAFAKELYDNQPSKDPNHTQRSLANALGFPSPTSDSATLNVPWIYVAGEKGAIAVFPGTIEIERNNFESTSRPWYITAFREGKRERGLSDEQMFSMPYQDVLAKHPILVRTYMYGPFSVEVGDKKQNFVVCVDIHRGQRLSGTTSLFTNMKTEDASFAKALWPTHLLPIHYVSFFLSVLFFTILRLGSIARSSRLEFRRSEKLYGRTKIEEAIRRQRDKLTTKEDKVVIDVGKHIQGKIERSKSERNILTGYIDAEKAQSNLRGFELWDVLKKINTTWSILGLRFGDTKTIYVGAIRLVYNSEMLPEADWYFFNQDTFSDIETETIHTKLLPVLQRNADLSEGSFDIPDPMIEDPPFLCAPKPPDWVRKVVDAKELHAVRQRRAYVRLRSEDLYKLYSDANVKAVMTAGWFEQLLNHEQTDFLLGGKTISRIISFPDQTAMLTLTEKACNVFEGLLDSYSSVTSRSLERVDGPINKEITKRKVSLVNDFAIINDSRVIVAHSLSKATAIDNASGRQTKSAYYVEGYMSWRLADIEFFRSLFDDLAGRSKEFDLRVNKAEIAQEI